MLVKKVKNLTDVSNVNNNDTNKCLEYQKEISGKAKACVSCRYPLKNFRRILKIISLSYYLNILNPY